MSTELWELDVLDVEVAGGCLSCPLQVETGGARKDAKWGGCSVFISQIKKLLDNVSCADSVVVSMRASQARDPGSNPGSRNFLYTASSFLFLSFFWRTVYSILSGIRLWKSAFRIKRACGRFRKWQP